MNASGTSLTDHFPSTFAPVTSDQPRFGSPVDRRQRDAERRVLFISYAFPPTGGGGVQRAVKFAKYLPSNRWRPTILTVANPSVPVLDHDFAADLDPDTNIVRARTWEPGYGVKRQLAGRDGSGRATVRSLLRKLVMQWLQPDPQILWNPSAYRQAVCALRAQSHEAIFVTGPPFSSFLLGCRLKKQFGIPLVLDFRDEWMLVGQYMENHQLGGLAYRRQQAMMQKALRAADAVITTTKASAAELTGCCVQANSKAAVYCIYNGFDPDDLIGLSNTPHASAKLRIVYTGTLWKLTDISPFVLALESLAKVSCGRAGGVELIIAGRCTPLQDTVLQRLHGTGVSVVRHDYLPHSQSLSLAATADHLLLLLADEPGAERVVPAKLFEYMALQKPILAISPEGETSELLRRYPRRSLRAAETARITTWLDAQLGKSPERNGFPSKTVGTATWRSDLNSFSRPSLTKELAGVLQRCVPGRVG